MLSEWIDKIIHGDTLEVMPSIPSEIADVVFWDPPYYLKLPKGKKLRRYKSLTDVSVVDEDWDKFSSFQEYDDFIEKNLTQLRRIMKTNGTIWIIGSYHNIHIIGKIMQDMGFWILNDVIWYKTNPMLNWTGVRFTNAIEFLIWTVKDKSVKKYYFDKVKSKEYSEDKIASCVWRLPICTGKERLKDQNNQKIYPTQKPEALLESVINVSAPIGGLVFDPMADTGTTAVVAKKLSRHFLVIEKEEKYVNAIYRRIHALTQINNIFK